MAAKPHFELYKDNAGKFRWRLKAPNGEQIAASQGYESKNDCKVSIESIVKYAPKADIVDTTIIWREKKALPQTMGFRAKKVLAVGILVAVIAVSVALFAYMSPFITVPSQITTQMQTSTADFNVGTTYQTHSTSTSATVSSVQKLKWISSGSNVISWEVASNYIGQTKTVEGTIVYTYVSKGTIFLDFHYPYQGYFYAVIFSSDSGKFPFSPASFYLNKEVRITGPIQLYKGSPEIIVRTPSQIEVAYMGFNYP